MKFRVTGIRREEIIALLSSDDEWFNFPFEAEQVDEDSQGIPICKIIGKPEADLTSLHFFDYEVLNSQD